MKVFDNLYFVGQTEFSAWAITTSQGIILLDAIFDYSVEDEVVGGLKKLGLDPAQIKYVIVSHGHLDHAGGAKFLQERFGSRLVMTAADYDLLDQQNPPWKPKRDMVATDGYQLTLGDTTLTLYVTPGHTEGTISTIIPVRDGGALARGGRVGRHALQLRPDQAAARGLCRVRRALQGHRGQGRRRRHPVEPHRLRRQQDEAARRAGAHSRASGIPTWSGRTWWRATLTTVGECAQAAVAGLP